MSGKTHDFSRGMRANREFGREPRLDSPIKNDIMKINGLGKDLWRRERHRTPRLKSREYVRIVMIYAVTVLGTLFLTSGCSHFKNLIEGDPEVRVHPSSKTDMTWGVIHDVEDITGLKWDNHDWDIYYVDATHWPDGKAAIEMPQSDRLVGGWTAKMSGTIKTKMAMYRNGSLGPRTLVHEIARGIYIDNGYDAHEYEPKMKELGLW